MLGQVFAAVGLRDCCVMRNTDITMGFQDLMFPLAAVKFAGNKQQPWVSARGSMRCSSMRGACAMQLFPHRADSDRGVDAGIDFGVCVDVCSGRSSEDAAVPCLGRGAEVRGAALLAGDGRGASLQHQQRRGTPQTAC